MTSWRPDGVSDGRPASLSWRILPYPLFPLFGYSSVGLLYYGSPIPRSPSDELVNFTKEILPIGKEVPYIT